MPWNYASHKALLHSDPAYKKRFYAMTRSWLKKKIAADDDYAFLRRVKRRIQTRRRRRKVKRALNLAKRLSQSVTTPPNTE